MNSRPLFFFRLLRLLLATWAGIGLFHVGAKSLDNFNGAAKSGWTDFTFIPGFGLPVQTNGAFRFEQPASPNGQALFSASQKVSETFELKEGRTMEFQVDVLEGGGKDSFAILAFIPTSKSAGSLDGYGFAKSTTDLLITKSINRYFAAVDGPAAALKQDRIRLILNLTAAQGSVTITTKVLDLDDGLKVLWQRTVVDSPAADVLAAGTDSPAAPYLTQGYFTLYLYQDFSAAAVESPYRAVYDNAEVFITENTVLDNFDDGVKSDWSDFTFVPGFGLPAETEGQFRFEQPASPNGQALFSASQKKSRVFDLKEGERLRFSVDLVQGGAKDSFAILAFIPAANSPGTLNGYGFANSTTDVLLTKGINRYFIADSGPAANLKQDNLTLTLTLSSRATGVEINLRIEDRDAGNAVIYDRTVLDTPGADVLVAGTDSPAAPFLTGGYFTLYLYQDFDSGAVETPYRAYYDNARVGTAPSSANAAPIISEILPAQAAAFLDTNTVVSFKVSDDQALSDARIFARLNGVPITTTNGLTLTGSGTTRSARFGGLASNQNYTAQLIAIDATGAGVTNTVNFDTFSPATLIVEAEDYNFDAGNFLNRPSLVPEGSTDAAAYAGRVGTAGIDFNDNRTSPNGGDTKYRPEDPIRMQRTLDLRRPAYAAAGGPDNANGVFDYDVGDLATGDWQNYTRDLAPGSYEVYLREAVANLAQAESVLELVISDRSATSQTVRLLGSFLGTRTGFEYRNFPLTDGSGQNKVTLRLSGPTTLRLRHVTADTGDASRYLNYLALVPVADPGLVRASVASLSPSPDSTTATSDLRLVVGLENHDTTIVPASIVLSFNGAPVIPLVTNTPSGVEVTAVIAALPPSGSLNTARIVFQDNLGVSQTNLWSFTITYASLDSATRAAGTGRTPGFNVRLVQAPGADGLLENSLQRAESQLGVNSSIPRVIDTNVIVEVINFSQSGPGSSDGGFPDDLGLPGAEVDFGTDNYALEVRTFLQLPAGVTRMGVRCDDGYKLASGAQPDANTPPLAFHNGGPADETFDIVVPAAGLYPFRLIWYERGGGAHLEWFIIRRDTAAPYLINSSDSQVTAFADLNAPAITVESAPDANGPFVTEAGAIVNATTHTITLPRNSEQRLYRLRGATGLKLLNVSVGAQLVSVIYQ